MLLIMMCLTISMIPVSIIGGFQGFQILTAVLSFIIISTFIVAFIMAYFISLPLEKLTKNINEISKGNLEVELEKSEIFEINNLTESLNRVMTSLKLAIQKVGVKKAEIFEETLKAKEEAECKYQDLLKNIDEWAWETNEKCVFIDSSPKVKETLGYTPEEVIGRSVFDLMPSDEAKKAEAVFSDSCKKQEPITKLENYYIHKNGQKICLYTNALPVFDKNGNLQGYRGVHKNLTTNVNSEQKIENLIQKNKKLREMRISSPNIFNETLNLEEKLTIKEKAYDINSENIDFDYFFYFDKLGNIVNCSENIYEKLGYNTNEMINLNLFEFNLFENKDEFKQRINKIKKNGFTRFKTIHKKKNGLPVLVTENITYDKKNNIFICMVKQDIN